MAGFKGFFTIEKKPTKGLVPLEWAVLAYLVFTLLLMGFMYVRLHSTGEMFAFRLRVVVLMGVMWGLYRLVPCRFTMFLRILIQMIMLSDWYPDTYEFNRCFSNLDYIFCDIEQGIFNCQPSLLFSEYLPWGIVSEPLCLGYVSYYPIIAFTVIFFFLYREKEAQKCAYMVFASFAIYYIIFIFLPVAGPTFYFKAVGLDTIRDGVFPHIGHYFENHESLSSDCLPTPGWDGGIMWNLVEVAKWAGERPTAAFPSSHVGVTTICMWILWYSGNRKVFYRTLPFAVLMFFATFYIQAHYLIDAIAGLISGTIIFFALDYFYDRKK